MRCGEYTTVKEISEDLGLEEIKVRASIAPAKYKLAEKGIVVCNKLGHGYRLGNHQDLEIECAKSVLRSYRVLKANYSRAMLIKFSGIDGDYTRIKSTLAHNLMTLRFIVRTPSEFKSTGEYQEYLSQMNITAEFLGKLAAEEYGG